MIQMNRKTRSRLGKVAAAVGVGMLSIVLSAGPVLAQEAGSPASTQPAPQGTTKLVAEGVGADGKIKVAVNKTVLIKTTQPYKQVSVGSAEIADVNAVGPNNILVTAKKQGTTQLIIWDDNNKSQVADVVVGMDIELLQTELATAFPGSKINVAVMNDSLTLRGQVPDLQVAEQAASMAQTFSPKVLNMLEVAGGQQIMLQVRFAEVSKRATNALGVNFAMSDGVFSFGSTIGQLNPETGLPVSAAGAIGSGVTLFGGGQMGNTAFKVFVNALRQNNLLRVLAEPNLVAISGQEASFLAGGEFPVPVPQSGTGGGSTITIEYREFGVRLNFVPVALGDGRIRLKMTPEVSDLDFSSPLIIQGSRIPIINKRTVTTTIELADGQTFAIAGLLNSAVTATKDVTPGLGDLPILGTLFRSVRYERRETELVVLVTPKLVAPMNPNQVPALPGENWRHPSEKELYLDQDLGGEVPMKGATAATGTAGAASAGQYRGTYGFTPPAKTTSESTE